MDEELKKNITDKYLKCCLHIHIGDTAIRSVMYNKSIRKQEYLIRRGERAKLKLSQFESIPFLAKGRI